MARRSSSKVPLAGHLPPDAPPAGETAGELILLLERIAWDVPGAASAAFVRVRWPGGSGSAETVLCLAGGDGDVDAARLRVTTSQSSFTHWVKQRCGGVEVAVKDATQRYHLGSARLDLSELRFASVSKALSGVRLPILSGGKPRGYLTLTASLSFDKEGQEFVHHVSIPDIPDNMASLGKRAKSPEDLFLLLGDYVDRDQIKVQSLFSICDKDKSGSLDKGELAALLEQLLGCRPSVLEMRFFWDMLDLDADGRVTFSEFAFIVSDCRRARLSAKERTVQVQDLMRKLAVNILQSDNVSLADAFNEFDADQSGVLEHREVVAMIRSLMPGVSKREERLLLANMHEMDTDADGVISLQVRAEPLCSVHQLAITYHPSLWK